MEIFKNSVEKIKEKGKALKSEVKQRTIGYIAAGFGLVAGLAWNEAIKALIEYLFPLDKNSLLAKFIYATLLTVAVVIITTYLTRLFKKDDA